MLRWSRWHFRFVWPVKKRSGQAEIFHSTSEVSPATQDLTD